MDGESNPFYRFFGVLSRYGIPVSASSIIIGELLYFGWLAIIYILYNIIVNASVFLLRDQLIILIMLPLFMKYIEKVENLDESIKKYVNINEETRKKVFEGFYSKLHSLKGNLLIGTLIALYYIILTTKYLLTGYYSFGFYMYRMVSIIGFLAVGSAIYQVSLTVHFLTVRARQFDLRAEALILGVPPVSKIAFYGALFWMSLSVINMLPSLVLGFNPRSLFWYLTFHSLMMFGSALTFVFSLLGFHRNMVDSYFRLSSSFTELIASTRFHRVGRLSLDESGTLIRIKPRRWPLERRDAVYLLVFVVIYLCFIAYPYI